LSNTPWKPSKVFNSANKKPEETSGFLFSGLCRLRVLFDKSGDVTLGASANHFINNLTILEEEESGDRGNSQLHG
jgi:hypothetical protein